jgi:Flp pilus assembly protein TadG
MVKLCNERGQTMIQLALMLVLLLGVAAIAVDVGFGYLERRRMQNAADAGALAGAYAICQGEPASVAITKAKLYMKANGVSDGDIFPGDVTVGTAGGSASSGGYLMAKKPVSTPTPVPTIAPTTVPTIAPTIAPTTVPPTASTPGPTPPPGSGSGTAAGVVSVIARSSASSSFAALLGLTEMEVTASAGAACGAANSACGLFPLAVERAMYNGATCGERIVIFNAETGGSDDSCSINGVDHPLCDCYECRDENGPFELVTQTSRGWLDFTGKLDPVYVDTCRSTNGCGTNEIVCRIEGDSGERVVLPACISGLRGIHAGAKDEIDGRAGDILKIGLFDSYCEAGSHCSGSDADGYFVSHVGCVVMEGWVQQFELTPKPGMPSNIKKIKSKAIIASKYCGGDCTTTCGSTDGSAAAPGELRAVSLVK